MKSIYVCHTLYHILVTLLKYKDRDKIILLESITEREHIVKRLDSEGYIVDSINERTVLNINIIYNSTLHKHLHIFRGYNIFLFNDWTNVGQIINKNRIEYTLIEDGYNALASKILNQPTLKRKIKKIFFNTPENTGWSEYCKVIEVNDKSIMPKDARWNKLVEVPRNELFKIDKELKNKILRIFNVPYVNKNSTKKMLLLTQPLGVDTWVDSKINSIEKQEEYYKNIVEKYKDDYEIYLKPHPRDKAEYSNFTDVTVLEKNVPIEVYEFVGGYYFDLGITHSSTALNFLTCVDEKIILNKSIL